MSWGISPWVYPVWDSLGFLDLGDYFLPHFRQVFNYYLLKYFLMVFLFVFFFWTMIRMLGHLTLSQRSLRLFVLISFNSFFFFPLCFIYFHHSIFHLTDLILCLSILLLLPSRVFLISCPDGSEVEVSACNVGDLGLIPGSGRSPGEGNGNPLQYSCLEIPWAKEPGALQSRRSQRVGHN